MITLTESAAEYLSKQIARESGAGIQFGVKSSGCSGLGYTLEVAKTPPVTRDWICYESHDLRIWVHGGDLFYVDGTTIDLQRQGLNERIIYVNGRETARCGCGESFSIGSE